MALNTHIDQWRYSQPWLVVSKVIETILLCSKYIELKDPFQILQGEWAFLFT